MANLIYPAIFLALLFGVTPDAMSQTDTPVSESASAAAADAGSPLQWETRVTPEATFLIDPALIDTAGPLIDRMSTRLHEYADRLAAGPAAADREVCLAAINQLLGRDPDPALRQLQTRIFATFVDSLGFRFAAGDRLRVTVVTTAHAKAHLRAGGTLPHTTYDAATDRGSIKYRFTANAKQAMATVEDLIVMVRPGGPVLTAGDPWFEMAADAPDDALLLALHGVAEFTLAQAWIERRVDPHWRWFSVGLAYAIALRAMDEAGQHDAAEAARRHLSTAPVAELRRNANLRYWLEQTHQPAIDGYGEDRLNQARAAFALDEIERLIVAHGTEWIAKVAADLNQSPTPGSRAIIASIQRHTGEVMDERLDEYQSFATAEDGKAHYSHQVENALRRQNFAAALPPAIRELEIGFDRTDPRTRENMAIVFGLLHDSGDVEQGQKIRRQFFPELDPESAPER